MLCRESHKIPAEGEDLQNFRPNVHGIVANMTILELIKSAEHRLNVLRDAEFTPQAELAALELHLALTKIQYEATMCEHNSPISEPGDYECFS